jgi:hypothetical protein
MYKLCNKKSIFHINPTKIMETNTLPLEKELEPIFTKQLPSFPDNVKDLLVKIAPFLAIIWLIIGVSGVGLASLFAPFAWFSYGISYGLAILLLIATIILIALAIPGLFNQKKDGWKYMYYAEFTSLVSGLLFGNWIGVILSAFIGFWILFQSKEKYS